MSSKKPNLVPLIALTAATATTCLAYFYLNKKKSDSKTPGSSAGNTAAEDNENQKQSQSQISQEKEPAKAQTNVFRNELKEDNDAPNLANVPNCDNDAVPKEVDVKKASPKKAPSVQEKSQAPTEKIGKVSGEASKQEAAQVPASNTESDKSEGIPAPEAPKCAKEDATDSVPIETPFEKNAPSAVDKYAKEALLASKGTVGSPPSAVDEFAKEALEAANEMADMTAAHEAAPVASGDEKQSTPTKEENDQPNATISSEDNNEATQSAAASEASPAKAGFPKDDPEVAPTPEKQEIALEEVTPEKNEGDEKKVEVAESDLWEFLQKEMQQGRRCAGCSTPEEGDKKFKPCAKCRCVLYCGKACQKKHWKQHKKVCCK